MNETIGRSRECAAQAVSRATVGKYVQLKEQEKRRAKSGRHEQDLRAGKGRF